MCEKLKDRYVVECKKRGEMAREIEGDCEFHPRGKDLLWCVCVCVADRYVEALFGIWDTFY